MFELTKNAKYVFIMDLGGNVFGKNDRVADYIVYKCAFCFDMLTLVSTPSKKAYTAYCYIWKIQEDIFRKVRNPFVIKRHCTMVFTNRTKVVRHFENQLVLDGQIVQLSLLEDGTVSLQVISCKHSCLVWCLTAGMRQYNSIKFSKRLYTGNRS